MKSALLTALCLTAVSGAARAEIRYVIHITVDGLRGDLLKNLIDTAPATYPNFKRFRDEGATTFNARCDFDYSETIPNHCCVVTGRPVVNPAGQTGTGHAYTSNGYSGNATTGDSIHQLGSAAYQYKFTPSTPAHDRGRSTAIYGGKSRLNLYVHSYNATKGRADTIGPDNGKNKVDFASVADLTGAAQLPNVKNAVVADITAGTLRNYSLVHFTDTDTGSTGGGHNVAGALLHGTRPWPPSMVILAPSSPPSPSAPAPLAGRVTIVLTADHGGGGGGSGPGSSPDRNHGDSSSILNYTVPVLMWGPGIPAAIEAHTLFRNRFDPAASRPATAAAAPARPPLRNADTTNLTIAPSSACPIEGSSYTPRLQRQSLGYPQRRYLHRYLARIPDRLQARILHRPQLRCMDCGLHGPIPSPEAATSAFTPGKPPSCPTPKSAACSGD